MVHPRSLGFVALLFASAALGCGGEWIGGDGLDTDASGGPRDAGGGQPDADPQDLSDAGPSDVTPVLDPPVFGAEARCFPLAPTERALSSSPEGFLWVVDTATSAPSLRVLNALDVSGELRFPNRFGAIDRLVAQSATVASVLADGAVWTVDDGNRRRWETPFVPGPGSGACGRLGEAGFVLGGAGLFERRGDMWLRWEGTEAVLGPGASLIEQDGACALGSDAVLFSVPSDEGIEIWALEAERIVRQAVVLGQTVAVGGGVAFSSDGEHLFSANGGARVAAGPVRAIAAAGSHLWVLAGDRLIRRRGTDDATWAEPAGEFHSIVPFSAGGVWLVGAERTCAVAEAPVRVRGIRSGDRGTAERFDLLASTPAADEAVELRLNGQTIEPAAAEPDGLRFRGTLGFGWNRLDLSWRGHERPVFLRRDPPVARSWEADIRPIYETHCAGSGCHVDGSATLAPNLDSRAAWVEFDQALRRRVVQRRDMPPPASREPSWGPELVRVIDEWLGGGMGP